MDSLSSNCVLHTYSAVGAAKTPGDLGYFLPTNLRAKLVILNFAPQLINGAVQTPSGIGVNFRAERSSKRNFAWSSLINPARIYKVRCWFLLWSAALFRTFLLFQSQA